MKGRSIPYSADEMAWLEANRLMVISDYARAFNARFNRNVDAVNLHALRKRKGWMTGRTGCFEKGLIPHNKGKPHPTRGRAAETQFKKGGRPHNTRFLGHERVSKGGYVEISIAEPNPHTGFERRHVLKHKFLWERENGPVPQGMVLKSLDGNRLNTAPSNWTLIPRATLPHLGGGFGLGYDAAPPELKPIILAIAKLKHAARSKDEGTKMVSHEQVGSEKRP